MSCCKNSFTLCEPIPACIHNLLIKTSVISGNVIIKFIDKFNKAYSIAKTTDLNGYVDINLVDITTPAPIDSDLPNSLLNEFAGQFKVIVYNTNNIIIPFVINGEDVTALIIEARSDSSTNLSYSINPFTSEGEFGQFNL